MGYPDLDRECKQLDDTYRLSFIRLSRDNINILRDFLWIRREWMDDSVLLAALLFVTQYAAQRSVVNADIKLTDAVDTLMVSGPFDRAKLWPRTWITMRMIFLRFLDLPTFALYNRALVADRFFSDVVDETIKKPKFAEHEWTKIVTEWREKLLNKDEADVGDHRTTVRHLKDGDSMVGEDGSVDSHNGSQTGLKEEPGSNGDKDSTHEDNNGESEDKEERWWDDDDSVSSLTPSELAYEHRCIGYEHRRGVYERRIREEDEKLRKQNELEETYGRVRLVWFTIYD
ncbi:hypothetical protein ABW21_db0203564 [Orbilia brochopaga]|nr:hypothetical protein ABW21_db0203564 [Drechslerella brochopaga]